MSDVPQDEGRTSTLGLNEFSVKTPRRLHMKASHGSVKTFSQRNRSRQVNQLHPSDWADIAVRGGGVGVGGVGGGVGGVGGGVGGAAERADGVEEEGALRQDRGAAAGPLRPDELRDGLA
jgi:hypothetical protein